MRSTMLSGTAVIALAALLSLAPGLAGAQTQTTTDTQTNTETTTEDTQTQTEVTTEAETEVDDEAVTTEAEQAAKEGVDAAELMGDSVEDPDGDVLGDIETLVVSEDGVIEHVVIGVGGFLGIGEREVALPWDRFEVIPEENRIVANVTREELEALPEFDWPEDYQEGTVVTTTRDDTTTATQTNVETTTEATDTQTEVTTEAEMEVDDEPVTDEAVTTEAEQAAAEGVDAAELMGDSVENAEGDVLGDIETLVVSEAGVIEHVVIGVGGFLGIGEKEVALPWDRFEVAPEEDRIVANVTREELEASPEFDWPDDYREGTMVTSRDDVTMTGPQMAVTDTDGDGVDDTLQSTEAAADEAQEAMSDAEDAGRTLQPGAQFLAGSLIGARILSREHEEVGEVDDVVLAADGSVQGVITEIGGFLGIAEKQVMILWQDLEVRRDEDGDILIRTGLDTQALQGLEDYDYEAAEASGGTTINN